MAYSKCYVESMECVMDLMFRDFCASESASYNMTFDECVVETQTCKPYFWEQINKINDEAGAYAWMYNPWFWIFFGVILVFFMLGYKLGGFAFDFFSRIQANKKVKKSKPVPM